MGAARVMFVACLASCGGGSHVTIDADIDAAGPQWWQPKVGEAKDWDIQLTMPDVSTPRMMYDLNLWDLVPSQMTLDYGDGAPVTVPAGSLAGTIAQLHARTPSTIVICHVETGILDLALPDASKFPGYDADSTKIPDKPTNPAAGSVIGWRVNMSMKRWLDISEAGRAKWIPIMFKRFDLAKQIGCDGVEPDRNLAAQFSEFTGFGIMTTDSYSWFTEIAKQGHARMLSTGMKNGHTVASLTDMEADKFDWLMIERCGEDLNCDLARPFINLQKAVFAIDYDHSAEGDAQSSGLLCPQQQLAMIADGIFKDVGLTKNVRTPCNP